MSRTATGWTKHRADDALDAEWRRKLRSLGLDQAQTEAALEYRKRGYTVEAAAKLVFAGGYRVGLFQGGAPARE